VALRRPTVRERSEEKNASRLAIRGKSKPKGRLTFRGNDRGREKKTQPNTKSLRKFENGGKIALVAAPKIRGTSSDHVVGAGGKGGSESARLACGRKKSQGSKPKRVWGGGGKSWVAGRRPP